MKLVITLAALFVSASLALAAEEDKPKRPAEGGKAGDGKRPNPEEFFKRLDTNSDGSVSKDEYLASPRAKQDPAKGGENFTRLDKDKDGKLTKEEFAAGMAGKGKRDGKGDAPKGDAPKGDAPKGDAK